MRLYKLNVIFVILKICSAEFETFIVNGLDAKINNWPFIAFIIYIYHNDTVGCVCGGSLLSSQTVLTAAHCLDDVTFYKAKFPLAGNPKSPYKKVQIRMGHDEWRKATMLREAVDYETHAKYDIESTKYDIGVLFLLSRVEFSDTVKKTALQMKPLEYPKQKDLLVAGWGLWLNGPNGTFSLADRLQYLPHELIPKDICEKSNNMSLVFGQICAGSLTDEKYVFSGDSGGPLVSVDGFQVGLVSFKVEENSKGITVFTHIPDFLDWIEETELKLFEKYCPDKIHDKILDKSHNESHNKTDYKTDDKTDEKTDEKTDDKKPAVNLISIH